MKKFADEILLLIKTYIDQTLKSESQEEVDECIRFTESLLDQDWHDTMWEKLMKRLVILRLKDGPKYGIGWTLVDHNHEKIVVGGIDEPDFDSDLLNWGYYDQSETKDNHRIMEEDNIVSATAPRNII